MDNLSELEYYLAPGPMTDVTRCPKWLLNGLPSDPDALMRIVRGCVISSGMLRSQSMPVPEDRSDEVQIRSVVAMIERIRELYAATLTTTRPAQQRFLGNCRHFATLTCALFRHRGIPTRVRAGFAGYFEVNTYADHWIIEYWRASEGRWIRVDPQLDEERVKRVGDVTSESLTSGNYWTGSEAWQECRRGNVDPNRFNMGGVNWGIGEVRGSVVLDVAALNKVEMLPWDCWGRMDVAYMNKTDSAYDHFLDDVSTTVIAQDFEAIRQLYESSDDLRVPLTALNFP
jgi:hypothetical protein